MSLHGGRFTIQLDHVGPPAMPPPSLTVSPQSSQNKALQPRYGSFPPKMGKRPGFQFSFVIFCHFHIKIPIKVGKITFMGRKGPRAKTKTVLKSVSQMQQLSSMQNSKFALCTIRITLLSAETNLWFVIKEKTFYSGVLIVHCTTQQL